MKNLMARIQFVSPGRALLALGVVAALAGCDRNEVKVYQVPKESSAPAPGVPATPPMAASETPTQPNLTWTLPEGWQEVPPGQMRLASFAATAPDGKKVDVSIVPLGGVAGGELGNVNRWRGQVGLAPVTEDELSKLGEKVQTAGSETVLYDLTGGKARILVTSLRREDTSWFFKMTGEDELVGQQKQKFIAFLKSLKFDSGAATQVALPPDHPALSAAPTSMSSDSPAKPQWTVPSGWTEEPPTQMLLAKFSTGDKDARAEITVSSFPGDVGGLVANINRWRRQLGLPAMDETAAVNAATMLEVQSEKASLVELDGTDAKTGQAGRLIGVVVPHDGQTWFFKMMGDGKVVAREKDAFVKFVQTVKLPHAP